MQPALTTPTDWGAVVVFPAASRTVIAIETFSLAPVIWVLDTGPKGPVHVFPEDVICTVFEYPFDVVNDRVADTTPTLSVAVAEIDAT